MRIKFASYNIHKGIGLDRRRDPERIMAVLDEIDAEVIALQEVDLRFGSREAVLARTLLDEHHWQAVPIAERPASLGWHGNAILVRPGIEIVDAGRIPIPALEPRGAISARLRKDGREFVVAGMHLDLSGFARRRQIGQVCREVGCHETPAVLMGDLNEWSREKGSLRSFGDGWTVLAPGPSFPSRRPLAMLDRIVHSPGWDCEDAGIHRSALASRASDHLPVFAELKL